ncbi:MAG: 30S ribosomal protein S16 [Candidatus Saganbacteria bacterium]|nr:30S ribosomal protein S16 [Candidatus Saganbacteria bacterium]
MSAKLRLSRVGSKSKPYYRVVVMDESAARDSKAIEILGHYDPRKEPYAFEVNKEKVQEWLKKGAIPTEVVRKYLGKIGIMPPVNFDKKKKKLPKGEQPAAEAPKPAEEKKEDH